MRKLIAFVFLFLAAALVLAVEPTTVTLARGETTEFNAANYTLSEFSLEGDRVAVKIMQAEQVIEPFAVLEQGIARSFKTVGGKVTLQRIFEEEGTRKAEFSFEEIEVERPRQITSDDAAQVFAENFPEYPPESITVVDCSNYYYCVSGWVRTTTQAGSIETEAGSVRVSNYSFLNGKVAWITKSGGEVTRVLATN